MKQQPNSHGDGSFTPDGNSQTENHEKTASTQETQLRKAVSPRKLQANRENAKRSAGPRTARGKRSSSFNALKHGLQAKKVMFAPDGKLLDEGLLRLFESLRDRYSTGEVVDELLIELAITDYWRLQKGLEYELKYLTPTGGAFHPQGGMPTLVRYMTANRRAFDKTLQMLKQLPVNEEAKAKTMDGDSNSRETAASPAPHVGRTPSSLAGKAPQKPAEASGLEQRAQEENSVPQVPRVREVWTDDRQ